MLKVLHIIKTQWILAKVQNKIVLFPQTFPSWPGVGGQSRAPERIPRHFEVHTCSLPRSLSTVTLSLTPTLSSAPLWTERNKNQKVDLDLDVRQIFNSMWPEIRHWNQNFVTTCRAISLKLKVIDLHGLGTRSLGWDPDLGSPITHLVPFSSPSPLSSCMILVSLRTQEVILKTKIFMESSSGH